MKKISIFIYSACLLSLVGCASNIAPYQQPSKTNSLLWEGETGLEPVNGSERIFDGNLKQGDVYWENQVRPKRTAVLLSEVRIKKRAKEEIVIPKGALAFAVNYQITIQGYQYNELYDPVEWCFVIKESKDRYQTICAFWQTGEKALYMDAMFSGGKITFDPEFYGAAGYLGPVPIFKEQKVDFPTVQKNRVVIDDYNERRLWRKTEKTVGDSVLSRTRLDPIKWYGGHAEIEVNGSRLKLSYDQPSDSVKVDILEKGPDVIE